MHHYLPERWNKFTLGLVFTTIKFDWQYDV